MSLNPDTLNTQDTHLSKSERTRLVILSAAARQFRDTGYSASTLRKIAIVAGVEAGSIYYHFGSKDEILDEVLDLGLRHVYDAVKAAREDCEAQGKGFRETFSAMVDAHLTFLLEESDFTSANIRNFSMLPKSMRERHRPLRRAYADLWDKFLGQALANGEIRSDIKVGPLRQFLIGALNWTVEWFDASRYSFSMLSEKAAALILDGMSTRPGTEIHHIKMTELTDVKKTLEGKTKAARTRSHILSAAARVMGAYGYSASTLRQIADAAKMEAGSIYYHFESKEAILDEVLDRGLRDMVEGVSQVLIEEQGYSDFRSRIADAINAHMMFLFARSEFTSANIRMYGQLPKEMRARHRPVRQDYSGKWEECLKNAKDAGEIRDDIMIIPLRQVILGALNWTVEWFNPEKGSKAGFYTLQEMVALQQSLLLDGIVSRTL